ncbi:MAG TPA: hypothetical protein GX521_08355 [Firmicutes bacterium]|nr:hypothetical protein [Bacillota bacterium]
MNLSAALVVYVLVAVISGVIRKLAENKEADQRQLDRTRDMRDRAVPFDEIDSAVEIFADADGGADGDGHVDDSGPGSAVKGAPGIFGEMEFGSGGWDEEPAQPERPSGRTPRRQWRPNMAEAVIMSEILRRPRAKRPWPQR